MTSPEKSHPRWKGLRKSASFVSFLALAAVFVGIFRILSFFLHRLPEPIGSRADLFVLGAKETLLLTVTAGIFGLLLGALIGLARLSRRGLIRAPAQLLIWVTRGTPLLVQILFTYFALPMLMPWLKLTDFGAAALALAMNVGVYNAEVIRAGVLAVHPGQTEAGQSLGLSELQVLIFIVFPQAIRNVIPPLLNNLAALLKDSSLASSIGLLELSLAGNRVSSETFLPVPVLTTVACIYLLLTTLFTVATHFLEGKLRIESPEREGSSS